MKKEIVIVKTDSQKDGIHYQLMEKAEAERKVHEWNSNQGGPAHHSAIVADVTNQIYKLLNYDGFYTTGLKLHNNVKHS